MTTEEALFCLLRNEICGVPLPVDFNLTDQIEDIYLLSKRHDIAHLIGDAICRNNLLSESKILYAFKQQMMMAVYRYEQQNAEFKRICEAFDEAKIPYIPLKGTVIRKYYPEPWMRTSCDIDILVKKEDYFNAGNYLAEKLNYKLQDYNSHDVSLYFTNNIHIELHHSLIEENYLESTDKILDSVWNNVTPCENSVNNNMSDEMFYFYHIAHMAKHLKCGGCGIRPFIDLYVLNHKVEFDKSKRNELLIEGGLLKFAEVSEKLSEIWLGTENHDETTLLLQDFIINGGVYGNIQNRATISKETTKKRSKFSYVWKPYDELKFWYPRLAKHKWLLPFYEVKRWFTIVFGGALAYKFKERKVLKDTEREEIEKSEELISSLGLKQD